MILKEGMSSGQGYCFITECGLSYYVVVIGGKTIRPFSRLSDAITEFNKYYTG